jgi:hypothetical protein
MARYIMDTVAPPLSVMMMIIIIIILYRRSHPPPPITAQPDPGSRQMGLVGLDGKRLVFPQDDLSIRPPLVDDAMDEGTSVESGPSPPCIRTGDN